MPMHDPPHPGAIVRRQCLEPLGLTVTEAAEGLGVTRQALLDLLNGKAVDMAIRLSEAFGSSAETWLGLQTAYDLAEAREPKCARPSPRDRHPLVLLMYASARASGPVAQ